MTINIDFDEIIDIFKKGVRRADVFMGVGTNASEHHPPISHVLARQTGFGITLVKEELYDKEKEHVANEFGKWVRANGLRELLETFSIYMHRLYSVILIKAQKKQLDREFNKCRPQKFERLGIGDQIDRMSEIITVADRSKEIVRCLNQARNCYAHRGGVIGASDIEDGRSALTSSVCRRSRGLT